MQGCTALVERLKANRVVLESRAEAIKEKLSALSNAEPSASSAERVAEEIASILVKCFGRESLVPGEEKLDGVIELALGFRDVVKEYARGFLAGLWIIQYVFVQGPVTIALIYVYGCESWGLAQLIAFIAYPILFAAFAYAIILLVVDRAAKEVIGPGYEGTPVVAAALKGLGAATVTVALPLSLVPFLWCRMGFLSLIVFIAALSSAAYILKKDVENHVPVEAFELSIPLLYRGARACRGEGESRGSGRVVVVSSSQAVPGGSGREGVDLVELAKSYCTALLKNIKKLRVKTSKDAVILTLCRDLLSLEELGRQGFPLRDYASTKTYMYYSEQLYLVEIGIATSASLEKALTSTDSKSVVEGLEKTITLIDALEAERAGVAEERAILGYIYYPSSAAKQVKGLLSALIALVGNAPREDGEGDEGGDPVPAALSLLRAMKGYVKGSNFYVDLALSVLKGECLAEKRGSSGARATG